MVRKVIPVTLILLTLGVKGVCAQEYSFRSFGVADGLNNLVVRRIFQDHVGFIWVSTENGIFRYDGDRFEPFGAAQGIPANSGATFGEAPDGSFLAGGDFGLYHLVGNRFEKIAGAFTSVSWAESIQPDGHGHTYVGTDTGLLEMDSEPGQPQLTMRMLPHVPGTSGPGAFGIMVDGDVLWYGCGHELCRMDGHGTRVFSSENGLPVKEAQIIQRDRAGNLWVRERNAGIFEWPAGGSGFIRPKLPHGAGSLSGFPALDRDGRIMILSANGLFIGQKDGWQVIDRSAGLRGTIYSAMEDRQYALWIGLAGRGIAKWRGYGEWESYSTESGLTSDLVYEILPQGDGSLWVGTESGLFRGVRRQFGMVFHSIAGMDGIPVHSLRKAPNGDVWVGTETRGVARVDARTYKAEWFGEGQGLTGKGDYTLRFDRQGRIWVATESGLFMARAPYRSFSRINELPATRMWAIAEGGDGTVWAGGRDGLFEFANGHWRNLTQADGLSNLEVLSLGAGPNGGVWVGYRFGGGIDRVQPKAGGVVIQKGVQRTGNDGLTYFLDFDAKGRLWAGTERGVDMWDGVRWSHFDVNDGLVWDDCNLNAFAEEADGTVWIGTGGGLSRFKPRPRLATEAPLEVIFTKLTIGQMDVSGLHNPSFGSHSNSLVVRYSALNAPRENGVVFRYRLRGATSVWTETGQRELQFANLAPGAYQIEIEVKENDGEWSPHGARFQFRILTPWYLTWWFAGLCVLIPASIAGVTLRLRFLGAKRRERELVQMVKEKTADLQRANEELVRLSFTDPLTGLANRRVFDQTLERECARLSRNDSELSLLSIDADHFKALNDSQGHQKGDDCLVALGIELTRLCRREVDLAARNGGEEFAIILPETGTDGAVQFAESVRQAIADLQLPHPLSPVAPFLTVSVGVATGSKNWCGTPEALVAAADGALYAAKWAGRNRVCVAEMGDPAAKTTKQLALY
jgi:diguanylate cyclase (GGDEF)-like protein